MGKKKRLNTLNENLMKNEKMEGYVYIGFIPSDRFHYKIGRTKNLNKRLVSLKAEYGKSFCFYYFSKKLYNNIRAEEYLHSQQEDPVKGLEWFYLPSLALDCVVADIHRLEIESDEYYELEAIKAFKIALKYSDENDGLMIANQLNNLRIKRWTTKKH